MSKPKCELCGFSSHSLLSHLLKEHNLSAEEYLKQFPNSVTVSYDFLERYHYMMDSSPKKRAPDSSFYVGKARFEIQEGVPKKDHLPLPLAYRWPTSGKIKKDIEHAAISLSQGRSIYISGVSGSGKDAFIHALCYYTKRPSAVFQITPGKDLNHWFFTRSFNKEGTYWEKGILFNHLINGYSLEDKKIPYLILISDFDRADKNQIETLRLILDSIQGRIMGPKGESYDIFPGTQIVVTANTTGGGDDRGHYTSVNLIDSSIISRFHAGFEFHWMEWSDEVEILKEKFSYIHQKSPQVFLEIKSATKKLREAIYEDELYCDFSHRDLCTWLQHAEDLLRTKKRPPSNLMRKSLRAWLDKLPDQETKLRAKRIVDSSLRDL